MNIQRDSDLIKAVLTESNSVAYTVLVRRYERLVWAVAWQVLRDYHATQDVTQETFLIAHKKLSELQKPESIGSWLSMISRREAQRIRVQRRHIEYSSLIEIVDPQETPNLTEEYQLLLNAISQLPDHERDVTALRYLNGHSVGDVAKLLDRPVGTVTKQLSRAVKRLQQQVRPNEEPSTTHPCSEH